MVTPSSRPLDAELFSLLMALSLEGLEVCKSC